MTSLSTLSSECTGLLLVAAVIGRTFDIDVLATVVGRAPLDCLDLLGEAGRLSLVEPDGGPGRHRFVQTTVHEGVLAGLAASDRVRLHARVAEAIGTVHADRIDAHLFELAAHWSAAAVGDYRQPAARWVLRAAEAAMGTSAYADAARLFRRALDIGGGALDTDERCRTLLGLATASYRSAGRRGAGGLYGGRHRAGGSTGPAPRRLGWAGGWSPCRPVADRRGPSAALAVSVDAIGFRYRSVRLP